MFVQTQLGFSCKKSVITLATWYIVPEFPKAELKLIDLPYITVLKNNLQSVLEDKKYKPS